MDNYDTLDLTRLLNSIRTKLVGASEGGIKQELYETLHEFFKTTNTWKDWVQFTTRTGVNTYDLREGSITTPSGQPIRLVGVCDNSGYNVVSAMGVPPYITLRDYPEPLLTYNAYVVFNVTMPVDACNNVPDFPQWVLPLHMDAITDGILGRMMGQTNKSFSDEAKSVYHLRRFRDLMAQARVAALRDNTFGTNVWRFPQGFAARGQRGGVSVGSDLRFT